MYPTLYEFFVFLLMFGGLRAVFALGCAIEWFYFQFHDVNVMLRKQREELESDKVLRIKHRMRLARKLNR